MRKYGRTYHLSISPGATSDDKIMVSSEELMTGDLIVTEKMDGENTTIHRGGTYARSPDSKNHPSRDWLKAFSSGVCYRLSPEERIVGENVYARHAIAYDALQSYFLGFSWILQDEVQSWDATLARFEELGIMPVPTLYRGAYTPGLFEHVAASLDTSVQEGFVVRVASGFNEAEIPTKLGKYVRAGHVQSDVHWMKAALVVNGLAKK